MSLSDGPARLTSIASALRAATGRMPGADEARTQAEVLARGAARAVQGRGLHRVQVKADDAGATVRVAGPMAERIAPALRRQRDAGIAPIRQAVRRDIERRSS